MVRFLDAAVGDSDYIGMAGLQNIDQHPEHLPYLLLVIIAMLRAGWTENLHVITDALGAAPGLAGGRQRILELPQQTLQANLMPLRPGRWRRIPGSHVHFGVQMTVKRSALACRESPQGCGEQQIRPPLGTFEPVPYLTSHESQTRQPTLAEPKDHTATQAGQTVRGPAAEAPTIRICMMSACSRTTRSCGPLTFQQV
jgi:hypothetical protein